MKYAFKILSLTLATITALSLTGCGTSIFEKVEATAVYNTAADDANNSATNQFSDDSIFATDENGEFVLENESEVVLGDNGETKPNNSGTTRPNNRVTTTKKRVTTTRPTTTQKPVTVPTGVNAIISAYNTAANRTKALDNMTVDKTNDVEIAIDDLAGNSLITNLANSVASGFMKDYNGQTIREVYVNGRPTRDTKTMDLQYPNMLANDKRLFIPVRNKNYLSNLTANDVVSATATRSSASTYKVVIKLKAESTDLNTPPAITTRGMDYFEQKVFDLQGFEFTSGTVNYKNCIITATVNADGYVDYLEHKMSVSSTNAKVSIFGSEQDAKLHGEYLTTFKFYI